MRLGRLDLNLLVALDVLLTERSVTIAADRLCLSQSATSGALGRLREYFQDELLINTGRKMILTARGEALAKPVRDVLLQIKTTINETVDFLPHESDRHFVIVASDYSLEVMFVEAFRHISELAPNMTFEILPIGDRPIEQLENREIDLLMSVEQALSENHPKEVLFTDDFKVMAWTKNDLIGEELTLEKYLSLGHVCVQFGKSRVPASEEYFLRTQKIRRRTEIIAPSFISVPSLIVGTQRIATIQSRLADISASVLPLKIYDSPVFIPPISQCVQWHYSASQDKALMWFVDTLKQFINAKKE